MNKSAGQGKDADNSQNKLRQLFLGECLEAWKVQFLFCRHLQYLATSNTSHRIKSLAASVMEKAERHLGILNGFIPDIQQTSAEMEEVFRTVTEVQDSSLSGLSRGEDDYEADEIEYLRFMVHHCHKTFLSLALEAKKFSFVPEAVFLEKISKECRQNLPPDLNR